MSAMSGLPSVSKREHAKMRWTKLKRTPSNWSLIHHLPLWAVDCGCHKTIKRSGAQCSTALVKIQSTDNQLLKDS